MDRKKSWEDIEKFQCTVSPAETEKEKWGGGEREEGASTVTKSTSQQCGLRTTFIFSVIFLSLFIFRRHSTRKPASGRVTYFILRAYTGTMC